MCCTSSLMRILHLVPEFGVSFSLYDSWNGIWPFSLVSKVTEVGTIVQNLLFILTLAIMKWAWIRVFNYFFVPIIRFPSHHRCQPHSFFSYSVRRVGAFFFPHLFLFPFVIPIQVHHFNALSGRNSCVHFSFSSAISSFNFQNKLKQ